MSVANLFYEGTGETLTSANLLLLIQSVGSLVVFLYISWICYRAYVDYGDGQLSAYDMVLVWLRGFVVLIVLLIILVT